MTDTTKQPDQELDQPPEILITSFRLEDFRGVDLMELDLTEHPRGVEFAGTKAIGKTSGIRGLEAIMWGAGIDKSAIKVGSDKAKASMRFIYKGRALNATRTISRTGTKAEVTGADGIPLPKGVEQLRAVFGDGIGSGGRDPLRIYSASKDELRKLLLQASPCVLTAEQLTRWCEEERPWNTEGHGQEVLARVKDMYFDQRTEAGRTLDNLKARLKLANERIEQLPKVTSQPEVTVAEHAAQQAEKALAVLRERRSQTAERAKAAKGTVDKIAEKRAQARQMLDQEAAIPPSTQYKDGARARFSEAKRAFEKAKLEMEEAEKAFQNMVTCESEATRLEQEARKLESEAQELEQTLANMQVSDSNIEAITAQIVEAEQTCTAAAQAVDAAKTWAELKQAKEASAAASKEASAAEAIWEKLNRIVKRLSSEATAELAKQGNPIPGLEMTPKEILWFGRSYDLMSDGEKLEFSVEVVKRTATGAKVMVIDKLEHLPPSLRPGFVRNVLRGGWVLFATLVQDGAMEIVDCYRLAQQAA